MSNKFKKFIKIDTNTIAHKRCWCGAEFLCDSSIATKLLDEAAEKKSKTKSLKT